MLAFTWVLQMRHNPKIAGDRGIISAQFIHPLPLLKPESLCSMISRSSSKREKNAAWGSAFIDQFSRDLKADFPDISGFSAKNLRYCRAFYRFYSDAAIWQRAVAKLDELDTWPNAVDFQLMQAVAQLPWSHNILIFTKARQQDEARFYIQQTIEACCCAAIKTPLKWSSPCAICISPWASVNTLSLKTCPII
jgi:predicted nuclease of restriction endonuclease-like (RecB) superfamily